MPLFVSPRALPGCTLNIEKKKLIREHDLHYDGQQPRKRQYEFHTASDEQRPGPASACTTHSNMSQLPFRFGRAGPK